MVKGNPRIELTVRAGLFLITIIDDSCRDAETIHKSFRLEYSIHDLGHSILHAFGPDGGRLPINQMPALERSQACLCGL